MNYSSISKNNGAGRFAPDGKRNNDDGTSSYVSINYNPLARASSGLSRRSIPFSVGALSRASFSAGLGKKFQRPMLKNNSSYSTKDGEEKSPKTSTLGQKRRFDGMSNLMARAGKGLGHRKNYSGNSTSKENKSVKENTSHTNNDVRVDGGGAAETSAASMELEVDKGSVETEQELGGDTVPETRQRNNLNREGDTRHSNGAGVSSVAVVAVSQEVNKQLTHSSPADGKRTSPQQQRDDNDGVDSPPKESRNKVHETQVPSSGASSSPLENFNIWQSRYRNASSNEELESFLLEDGLPQEDVDKIMHCQKNDCIQEVFTNTSEWQQLEQIYHGLPEDYYAYLGGLQPFDGLPPHHTWAKLRLAGNFAPLLDGRLFEIDEKGKLTICWQTILDLSSRILHKGYDIQPEVGETLCLNTMMSTNLLGFGAVFDLLSNHRTKHIYDYLLSKTEGIMTQLETKMPTLLPGLKSMVTFGKNPYEAQQRMMEKHPELKSSGIYHQSGRIIHMTVLTMGWGSIDEVMFAINELSHAFSTILGVPYYEFDEDEAKDVYDFYKKTKATRYSRQKVRTLIETTIKELEDIDPVAALHLQCIAQSPFAEHTISNMSRKEAIGFKKSLQHTIDNNMEHTIAERRCNECNRDKICAYNTRCSGASDNDYQCQGRCQDKVIRQAEEPFTVITIQPELMLGMCSEPNCGFVGKQRQQCPKRFSNGSLHGLCNNPITLSELQPRTPMPVGSVTNTTTQYFMVAVPCVMVDNNNIRIDEQVFYKTTDAATRVLEIRANPTVLDLGGPSMSTPRVLNIKNKHDLSDRISILLWNNGSYDGEINFGNFRLRGLGIGQHRDPNEYSRGCGNSANRPAHIITRYQEER